MLKELLESSLSQVEDYASSIRETAIEELALQLERLVLLCKDKLKHIVPELTEQARDDDVDPDDAVPFDWSPPPTLFTYLQ